ncbi:MAG: phasin family protein [Beijerinckiaceae bacterium]|nr:phasin family protein [Beijerinckiaceae bacterium]
MYQALETVQKTAKDNFDLVVKNVSTTTKGVQAIATETTDYTKKAFEQSSAVLGQLAGSKSVEKALELQASYARNAYEGFVSYATKLGTLYTDLAKESMKPFEGLVSRVGK